MILTADFGWVITREFDCCVSICPPLGSPSSPPPTFLTPQKNPQRERPPRCRPGPAPGCSSLRGAVEKDSDITKMARSQRITLSITRDTARCTACRTSTTPRPRATPQPRPSECSRRTTSPRHITSSRSACCVPPFRPWDLQCKILCVQMLPCTPWGSFALGSLTTLCLLDADQCSHPSGQMVGAGGWMFPGGYGGYNAQMMNAPYMYPGMPGPMSPTQMRPPFYFAQQGGFGNTPPFPSNTNPNFPPNDARAMGGGHRHPNNFVPRPPEFPRPNELSSPQIRNLSSTQLTRILVDVLRDSPGSGREIAWSFFERSPPPQLSLLFSLNYLLLVVAPARCVAPALSAQTSEAEMVTLSTHAPSPHHHGTRSPATQCKARNAIPGEQVVPAREGGRVPVLGDAERVRRLVARRRPPPPHDPGVHLPQRGPPDFDHSPILTIPYTNTTRVEATFQQCGMHRERSRVRGG